MKKTVFGVVVGLAVAAGACAGGGGSQAQDTTATEYLGIRDFKDATYQDVWIDIQSKLNQEFASLCGGTFCADYPNLVGLSLNCAVSSKLGSVHDCAWTFTGSDQVVDPKTAAIHVDAPTFQCHFKPKTSAGKLVTLLSGSADAIHETLPGTTGSIADALGECFQHPIGSTPITVAADPNGPYVEPLAYYTSPSYQTKWRSAEAALKNGFNNVCGDTFCGSDYGDLQSLAFTCAVTKSSGNVKSCAWVFGGSYSLVGAAGTVDETSQSFTCPVPMKGTIGQLLTTLNANLAQDAIHRPLPGVTTSAYDALGGCLP